MLAEVIMPEKQYTDWSEVPLSVTMPEAARVLGVHLNTVRKLVKNGDLPHFKIGTAVKIRKTDLMRYMGETLPPPGEDD